MALTMTKSITITGTSTIDGVIAEGYSAKIDSNNPENINFSNYQQDKALYKANRDQCRVDRAEFEDACYEIQDEMITEKEVVGTQGSLEERVSALEQQAVDNI